MVVADWVFNRRGKLSPAEIREWCLIAGMMVFWIVLVVAMVSQTNDESLQAQRSQKKVDAQLKHGGMWK